MRRNLQYSLTTPKLCFHVSLSNWCTATLVDLFGIQIYFWTTAAWATETHKGNFKFERTPCLLKHCCRIRLFPLRGDRRWPVNHHKKIYLKLLEENLQKTQASNFPVFGRSFILRYSHIFHTVWRSISSLSRQNFGEKKSSSGRVFS